MVNPKVTFVVPCYNLAHLLSECVTSILSQTYENFEILIMDDCSPDNTPEVAKSFSDPRVTHIRNDTNLRHLSNYNKGISLARGKYVWLISADDCLRKPYVLERFVELMDEHPQVGYVFCPSMRLQEGHESDVMKFTAPEGRDTIFKGRDFLRDKLLQICCVPAPAAMARKSCYNKYGFFPLDLPYSGDWYLWCVFAFYADVGYFAEPMVYRRFHPKNISKFFYSDAIHVYLMNQVLVPWRMKELAEKEGDRSIQIKGMESVIAQYVSAVRAENQAFSRSITLDDFEHSLQELEVSSYEERKIRSGLYAGLGDHYFENNDTDHSLEYYRRACKEYPGVLSVHIKYLLCRLGTIGALVRSGISCLKRTLFQFNK